MPLATIYIDPELVDLNTWLRTNLQQLICWGLGVPNSEASLDDKSEVDLKFFPIEAGDVFSCRVSIVIIANPYPERNEVASDGVQAILDHMYREGPHLYSGDAYVLAPLSLAYAGKPKWEHTVPACQFCHMSYVFKWGDGSWRCFNCGCIQA